MMRRRSGSIQVHTAGSKTHCLTDPYGAGWVSVKISKNNTFGEGPASDEVLFAVEPPLSAQQRNRLQQLQQEQAAIDKQKQRERVHKKKVQRAHWREQKQLRSLERQCETLIGIAIDLGEDCDWQVDEHEDVEFAAVAMGLRQLLKDLQLELGEAGPSDNFRVSYENAQWFVKTFGLMEENWPQKVLRKGLREAKALHRRLANVASDEDSSGELEAASPVDTFEGDSEEDLDLASDTDEADDLLLSPHYSDETEDYASNSGRHSSLKEEAEV